MKCILKMLLKSFEKYMFVLAFLSYKYMRGTKTKKKKKNCNSESFKEKGCSKKPCHIFITIGSLNNVVIMY